MRTGLFEKLAKRISPPVRVLRTGVTEIGKLWDSVFASIASMGKSTMRAVVFKGPYKVELEERPIPQIQEPTDIIVKVKYTALCGR